jgi:potassium channel subfamily K
VTFFTFYEDMSFVDGWYFTTVTVTTVGYGVIVPSNETSRMVCALYTLCSCVLIAFGLAMAITSMLKAFDTAVAEQGIAKVSIVRVIGFRAIMTGFMLTLTITIGTVIGVVAMELSFWNGFYWSVISLTTVGYGDFAPKTSSERIWGGLFVLFGTTTFAIGISQIMAIFMINAKKKDIGEFMTPPITKEKIAIMDFDGNGEVTKDGYLKFMLVKGGFVDRHVIEDLCASFHVLDVDGSGVLNEDDCNMHLAGSECNEVRKTHQSKIDAAFEDY